ncbi:MAG: RNA polymerase sigma factor [Myxococcales bacterium]|nr:RNA polymerase sigma factor [Myxococcales bacterium]
MRSDDELLEAWRAGDKRAGRELFERHYLAVDRFFRNKVGEEAADLAQKTFLGCLEAAPRYQNQQRFRSWLFAIAYRQLCKHYRTRAGERARFDFEAVSVHDLDPTPSSVVVRGEEERLLLEALRQLPVEMQTALELHYWERMSDAEIAVALEQPLGTIKSRLRRARQLLAQRLQELASSPQQLRSTVNNLDLWAARIRDQALDGDDGS